MDNPAMNPAPPPYSANNDDTPVIPANATTPASVPQEPPPKYELPKDGPYAEESSNNVLPAGYPQTGQQYPIQLQPGMSLTII